MGAQPGAQDSRDAGVHTANDRFKADWSTRLAWSTMGAAGVHAFLFIWSPSWAPPDSPAEGSIHGSFMEAIALEGSLEGTGGIMPAVLAVNDPESPVDADEFESVGGGESSANGEMESGSGALRQLLRGRASIVPTVVESTPEPESDDAVALTLEAEAGERLRIGGDASTPDFERLAGQTAVDLERLSAVRPELALYSPSSWVLIENPTEVVDFLKRRLWHGRGDDMGLETVSVALWIDERGSVEWAEINRSSGRLDFDAAALELFREVASFRPARERGVRVPIAVIFYLPLPARVE